MLFIAMCSVIAAEDDTLVTSVVEEVYSGYRFTEGPLWVPGEGLIFSDIPADTIYRGDGTVFRSPSGKSNGLTLDREGRLIACEHWTRAVTRTGRDGTVTPIAETWDGKRLNSPNDIVVRSDGTIFFTDPPYGLEGREKELDFSGIFAISPGGELSLLEDGMQWPNGLAFSPDETLLYVADSGEGYIQVFDVAPDGSLSNSRRFCDVPTPDGMKADQAGRIWTTAADGVRVYTPEGTLLTTVAFPEQPANCAFGGEDGKTLYVTARTGVYKVRCAVPGVRPRMHDEPTAGEEVE